MEWSELQERANKMARPFIYFMMLFSFVFFGVNYWMLEIGSPNSFQRLGSLWVAVLVLVFGFTRLILSVVSSAVENPEDLEYVAGADLRFSFARFNEPEKSLMDAVRDDQEHRNQTMKLLSLLTTRIFTRVLSLEVLILCTATLQWGCGDLFHCWWNENGWQVCN